MICPCCGKEWNTDLHNSCICGAVITQKAPQNLSRADAYSLLGDGWRDRSDKSYYNEVRILIFTPDYEDVTTRWRIIDSQFMDLCKEASHWKKLDEPAFA